jgi:thiol-disulfide isomerase/thioredoxin
MKRLIFSFLLFFFFLPPTFSQQKFTAYIFMAEECPVCNYLGKTLKRLSNQYKDEVNFVAVFPQRMSHIKSASLFKKKYDLSNFTVEIDSERILTNTFNANVTPEVVVVNNNNIVLYQGRINDSYAAPGRMRHGKVKEDLELAIQKIISLKSVPKPWPKPIGCYITKR